MTMQFCVHFCHHNEQILYFPCPFSFSEVHIINLFSVVIILHRVSLPDPLICRARTHGLASYLSHNLRNILFDHSDRDYKT